MITFDKKQLTSILYMANAIAVIDGVITEGEWKTVGLMLRQFCTNQNEIKKIFDDLNQINEIEAVYMIRRFCDEQKEFVSTFLYSMMIADKKTPQESEKMIWDAIVSRCELPEPSGNMMVDLSKIRITLGSSVSSITKEACMFLSGIIENGILLTANPTACVVIYNDRIDFGKTYDENLKNVSGSLQHVNELLSSFYIEYGNVVYRWKSFLIKCSLFRKQLKYVGNFPPTEPDNTQIFNLIYPKFK